MHIKELLSLKGKCAVVIGGGGKIGYPMAEALAEAGATVYIASTQEENYLNAVEQLGAAGLDGRGIRLDQSNEPDVLACLKRIREECKTPDVLINCGVARPMSQFFDDSVEMWDRSMTVNARGLFIVCRAFANAMAAEGGGSIINVASIYGLVAPDPTLYEGTTIQTEPDYPYTKGGMIMFSQYLAAKFAKQNVRVNTVAPGGYFNNQGEPFHSQYCRKVPMGRMAVHDERGGRLSGISSVSVHYWRHCRSGRRFHHHMNRPSILILGAGGMGEKHVRAFGQTARCEIYGFDASHAAIERLQARNAVAGVFTDLHTIPARCFSGAVIATPTDTHLDYARWCLDQAIPFLVEKPIATRVDGLKELIADCKARNLLSGVAFPRRSGAAIQELKRKLRQEGIGELKLIRTNFAQDFRKYRPDYRNTYYAKLASGGGAIMDALSHHINLACYFGGRVRQVNAFHDRLIFEGVEGEDCAFINLRFRNGVLAAIHGNQFQKPNEDFIELVGSAGNLRYERLTGSLTWNMSDSADWHRVEIDGDWNAILRSQAGEFLDAIEGKGTLKTSLEDGLHHLQVALAARLAQEIGSAIEVPE